MTATADSLIRSQVMLSTENIKKLDQLSKLRGTSKAEIIRLSIESYNPELLDIEDSELMELVSERLKDAIQETAKTRIRLDKTLKTLEVK